MDLYLLPHFIGREAALKQVMRYSIRPTMFYRTNLWTHSKHVQWLMMEIVPFAKEIFGDHFDVEKAVAMAAMHDDHEIIMGDFQLGNKILLSAKQIEALHEWECQAIEEIAKRFPEFVDHYRYKELMDAALRVDNLEAEVLKFVDKFEGFGEALHELFAGNKVFASPVTTKYGHPPTPFQVYYSWLTSYAEKFPKMKPLTQTTFSLFAPIEQIDELALVHSRSPHTMASLQQPTGYSPYDSWKQIILNHAEGEDLLNLYVQKEFLDE